MRRQILAVFYTCYCVSALGAESDPNSLEPPRKQPRKASLRHHLPPIQIPDTTFSSFRDTPMEDMSEIALPKMVGMEHMIFYIGSKAAAENAALLSLSGITHVVSITSPGVAPVIFTNPAIRVLPLVFADANGGVDLRSYLDSSYAFIEAARMDPAFGDKKRKILIHCTAGISRSVSLFVGYLIRKQIENDGGGTQTPSRFDSMLEIVKESREKVDPNMSFELQLRGLEKAWIAQQRATVYLPDATEAGGVEAATGDDIDDPEAGDTEATGTGES